MISRECLSDNHSLLYITLVLMVWIFTKKDQPIGLTEAFAGSIVLPNMFTGDIARAILETLAYSDIFEFPLRLEEIHRYLPCDASTAAVEAALASLMECGVEMEDDYYILAGRKELVDIREQREAYSRTLLPSAMKYGRIIGSLPFVRMVGLTGSLAVLNVSKDPDFDYMLVTVPGRLWTARAFVLLFNRVAKRLGHTICPNLIVAETALEWPLHDLYSARELSQMIPITGLDVYQRLLQANVWAKDILPNAFLESSSLPPRLGNSGTSRTLQMTLELPLRGKTAGAFEQWEMNRKIARFSKQDGFGTETNFSAQVCQGNFHHHRKWTEHALQERMNPIAEFDLLRKGISELVQAKA
jgi:hypothetical protein